MPCDDAALAVAASLVLRSATLTAVGDVLRSLLSGLLLLSLQIWKAVADMLNKQSGTADKGSSSLVVCREANNSPSKGHVLRSASVDVFWDSVMGCDAESLGDLFTSLPKRWESITHIPERSLHARKRDTGLRTWTRNSYRVLAGKCE